jgi:hypothetical protein
MNRDHACRPLLAAAMLAMFAQTACSSEPETPTTPVPDAGATTAPPPQPPPPPPPPPEPVAGPCDATITLALQTAIQAREKAEVTFGLKPEGQFQCQTVPEGGMVQVPVTLQQGKCYTALAHSFPNVTEVDMFLKPNLGPNPNPLFASLAPTLAQDSETGPTASIASGKNCYKNALPLPIAAVIEVKARTGAGPVAVQVYSK